MNFKNSLWINKTEVDTKNYFLDYSNIQYFTPSWLKFTLLNQEAVLPEITKVTFQVQILSFRFKWDADVSMLSNGFQDELKLNFFHSFSHRHTFSQKAQGCYIEDELNIQVFRFPLLNKVLAPFLHFGLKQAFNERNDTCYKLLFDYNKTVPYVSCYDRLLLLKRKFELTEDLYLIPIFLATKKLYQIQMRLKRFSFLIPKTIEKHLHHFDQINNRVIQQVNTLDFNKVADKDKFKTYLDWEQESIVAPYFWQLKSLLPKIYAPILGLFYFHEKELKFRYFSLSFGKMSSRKRFSYKFMRKITDDYNPKRLMDL